jgi:hypothetical protein
VVALDRLVAQPPLLAFRVRFCNKFSDTPVAVLGRLAVMARQAPDRFVEAGDVGPPVAINGAVAADLHEKPECFPLLTDVVMGQSIPFAPLRKVRLN